MGPRQNVTIAMTSARAVTSNVYRVRLKLKVKSSDMSSVGIVEDIEEK